jgi:hypothetical protein
MIQLARWLATIAFSHGVYATSFFVSPDGSDTNTGSIDLPFATLQRARDAIRGLKAADRYPLEGVVIEIRGGEYALSQTFELTEEDSGKEKSPVIYRAYIGEKVIVHGGRIIDARYLESVTDEAVLKRIINGESRRKVRQVDLRKLGITDYGTYQSHGFNRAVVPAPMELFYDGKPMTLARYPNDGPGMLVGEVIDEGSLPRYGDYSNRGAIFKYTDDRHKLWANLDDVWIHGTLCYGYADDTLRIAAIDPETRRVTLDKPHLYGVRAGRDYRRYYALNLLEELDRPGEYYIDRTEGILYFWPPTESSTNRLAVSVLEDPVFALEGASHVAVRGITIELARGMGVYLEGGRGVSLEGCTVRNVGTSGIFVGKGARQTFPHFTFNDYTGVPQSRMVGDYQNHIYNNTSWNRNGGRNHRIVSCDIYNTGAGGVSLSGGSKRELIPGNNLVENCRIWDYQRRYKFLWSGINVDGCGNRIAHNEIFNADFQAIYVHGNDHIFEYNDIHHVALDADDVSAWYMGRDPSDRGNIIRYNYFHDIGRKDRGLAAIYLDDTTSDTTIFGNVFHRVEPAPTFGVVVINSGQDNLIDNNVFIECDAPSVYINSMFDRAKGKARFREIYFGEDGILRRRLTESIDIFQPPYSERYPKLRNFLDRTDDGRDFVGMRPTGNKFRRNVFFECGQQILSQGINARLVTEDNIEFVDPGFVDAENGDFRLRKDSPVFEEIPGFAEIPFEKIGNYVNGYRK